MKCTIYVFEPSVTDFEEVLAPGHLRGSDAFEPVHVRNVRFRARAYLQRNRRARPAWLADVLPACQIDRPDTLWNQTNSLVVAVRTASGTMCALTHGQGFLNLNRDLIVEGCGLDLAHRILRPDEVKAIDSKGVGAGSLHKRHVASRPGDLSAFPLNYYRDRIKKIEGKSGIAGFGSRFSGSTSCTIIGKVTFSQLGEICEALVAAREAPKHRRFAATQPYTEVQDPTVVTALRRKLLRAISAGGGDIGMFAPEIEDWSRVASYSVSYAGGDAIELEDLESKDICRYVKGAAPGAIELDKIQVLGLDDDGHKVFGEPFEALATFELSHGQKPYALSDGKWFLLDQDFVAGVQQRLAEAQTIPHSGYLPLWTPHDSEEAEYNARVQRADGQRIRTLDRDTITVDGRQVEPCDLVSKEGDFIHVKKWTASQPMSALLKQGENAALMIRNHLEFRRSILAKLPAAWRTRKPWSAFVADFRAPDFRIVYAIADKPHRDIPADLPIFSRLSLVETIGRLRADNFNVAVAHIPIKS